MGCTSTGFAILDPAHADPGPGGRSDRGARNRRQVRRPRHSLARHTRPAPGFRAGARASGDQHRDAACSSGAGLRAGPHPGPGGSPARNPPALQENRFDSAGAHRLGTRGAAGRSSARARDLRARLPRTGPRGAPGPAVRERCAGGGDGICPRSFEPHPRERHSARAGGAGRGPRVRGFRGTRGEIGAGYLRLRRGEHGGRRSDRSPIHASDIPRVLAAQGAVPVFADSGELAERLAPGIYVCDGESTADVDRVAERLARQPSGWLAAGPAALAEAIAERLRPGAVARPAWPVVRTCLIVNGSLHPVSLAQVRYAAERGCAGGSGWDLLPLPEAAGLSGQAYAARLGEAVRAAIQARLPDALVIFGGDTAAAILRALGCTALRPVGELLPGVPLARLERRALWLISKAGGFGPPDVLCALRNLLS